MGSVYWPSLVQVCLMCNLTSYRFCRMTLTPVSYILCVKKTKKQKHPNVKNSCHTMWYESNAAVCR